MIAPKGSRLRAALMQSILSASIVLGGLILWRIFGGSFGREPEVVVVKDATEEAYDRADAARRQIQIIERKAWSAEDPPSLTATDLTEISRQLAELETADRRFERLDGLLRKKKLEGCGDMSGLTACWLRTRIWKLDAQAVVGVRSDPSSLPGLYIPMHRALARWQEARRELAEVRSLTVEIPTRQSAEEKRLLHARIRTIRETLVDCRDEFLRLEGFLCAGLKLESLPVRDLPDVELLRENASLVQQAMASAGQLDLLLRE